MNPRKAYLVPLHGKVVRTFLVYAASAEQAREIMRGDRRDATALSDDFEETGLGHVQRAPEEDEPA